MENYTTEINNRASVYNKKKYNQQETINEFNKLMVITQLLAHSEHGIITPNKQLILSQFNSQNRYEKMTIDYLHSVDFDIVMRSCMTELKYTKKG